MPTSIELREQVLAAADRLADLRQTPETRRGENHADEVRAAVHEVQALDVEFEARSRAEAHEVAAAAFLAPPAAPESRGPAGAFHSTDTEVLTPGDIFTRSDAYTNRQGANIGEVEVRNLLTGSSIGTSGSHLFAPVGTPFLAPQGIRRMNFFLRDVLSVQSTGLQSVPYIRELNALLNEGGASAVAEASAKPEVTMQFESADAPIRKIAAWIQATMEAYDDAPTLAGYVNGRLAYMLIVEEERQVLNGNGSAPNLRGILNTSGVQTQTATTGDVPATIANAIGKVEAVDGLADGVAMHPIDYWTQVAKRHATGFDGAAQATAPFGNPAGTIWGLPVVRTRAIAQLKAIVGAWALGATLYERMGTTIRTTDSHASLFISNTLVVLAEERVGLAVHRPDFFVDTTIAHA